MYLIGGVGRHHVKAVRFCLGDLLDDMSMPVNSSPPARTDAMNASVGCSSSEWV